MMIGFASTRSSRTSAYKALRSPRWARRCPGEARLPQRLVRRHWVNPWTPRSPI
ncbi:unnamed protein product [Durusdinium trenchii]|uniref:Uncharacterized protein n=1 Tax=Durusdinium trenchii TaxID=1381693 RepID=A0ABP0J6B2_9DINO